MGIEAGGSSTDCNSCREFYTNDPKSLNKPKAPLEFQGDDTDPDDLATKFPEGEELVTADPSDSCWTESTVDESTGEVTPGVPIANKCQDGPCDNDDPSKLCDC